MHTPSQVQKGPTFDDTESMCWQERMICASFAISQLNSGVEALMYIFLAIIIQTKTSAKPSSRYY